MKRYPIGIQTFENIIEGNYIYVDKTSYIKEMRELSKYIFLSRPRRFGKSLFVSTLKSYFEGRKELFEGLDISKTEKDWIKYPVFHFSMATAKHLNKERLESELNLMLLQYENIYGKGEGEEHPNQRLLGLIKRAYSQTGQKAVLLIDEYDAPLLDVVHTERLPELCQVMRNFYSPIKDLDPYLQFVFITGITKFSQLSIFSELNNLKKISMNKQFAAVCGITENEIRKYMSEGIKKLAESEEISEEEALILLKHNYDGYHFTWPSPDIYNPFSIINALVDSELNSYWMESGTPTYLVEMLRKFDVLPTQIGGMTVDLNSFDVPTENMTTILPLLYQSGYLTIRNYDKLSHLYTLDIPNNEVREGLMKSLLPNYVNADNALEGRVTIAKMSVALCQDNLEEFFTLLKTYLSSLPKFDNTDYEGHYQCLLYVILQLLSGYRIDMEIRSGKGRLDLLLQTASKIYIMELKISSTAESALKQIEVKDYQARFAIYDFPIVKIGINFDVETHTISEWKMI